MNAVMTRVLRVFFVLALFSAPVAGDEIVSPVEDLGNGRYRVGAIEIDKDAQRFTVPGTAIGLAENTPIEFLAVAKGGIRATRRSSNWT